MRLAGPMQSWGVNSRFSIRETLTEPSKSGVIGLLCAALGWDRAAKTHVIAGQSCTLTDLSSLKFGVRVVHEGVVRRDYHTAQNVLRAKAKLRHGKPTAEGDLQQTVLSERYYLSDAYFLVGFESDDLLLLQALDLALVSPYWPLSLGRKSFVPSHPVRFSASDKRNSGVADSPLIEALLAANADDLLTTTRFVVDAPMPGHPKEAHTITGTDLTFTRRAQRTDVPLSFLHRQFAPREVCIYAMPTQSH